MFKINKIKLFSVIFAGTVLILLGAGTAFGQVTLPTISTACELKDGSFLSFNDGFSVLKKCTGNSRRVVLVGAQGPKGDKGDLGAQGLPGPQGIQGPAGSPGPKGDKGDTGTGQTGSTGPQGPQGAQGPAGITGAGNVAFVDGNSGNALTTDGKTWRMNGTSWVNDPQFGTVPKDVPIATSNIIQWSVSSFLDSSGNVWSSKSGSWVNQGHP